MKLHPSPDPFSDDDVFDMHAMADDAVCQVETRRRWREFANLGYVDALRALSAV